MLFEAESFGLLPKDLAGKLGQFKVTRYKINHRIHRMNKRVEKEFGEQVGGTDRLALGDEKLCIDNWGGAE